MKLEKVGNLKFADVVTRVKQERFATVVARYERLPVPHFFVGRSQHRGRRNVKVRCCFRVRCARRLRHNRNMLDMLEEKIHAET